MTDSDRKVVIITGASRGIGAGLVTAYRRLGWHVVANSRTITTSDDKDVLTIGGDVSEVATADRIVRETIEHFGRIDSLVNNAGIFISKPFTDYSQEDYAAVVAVNLTGFFVLTQSVIVEMLERGSGHVVNISTTLVDSANSKVPSVLASLTKGGVAAATKSLAIEYATRGIRVNAVSLGVIRSSLNDPKAYDGLTELHPLKRVGEISDVVNGILFLESSPFVTGEIVHIDGGQSAGH
jgi:NAD(P)-dependent dehydrogenase (short-subunit alcohol dehydrogenase family)